MYSTMAIVLVQLDYGNGKRMSLELCHVTSFVYGCAIDDILFQVLKFGII